MAWRRLGLCALVVLWLVGCATHNDFGQSDTSSVGQQEKDLLIRQGPPQEILKAPGGGKIYVYTTIKMDQVAAMGGGAWAKRDQVYYWLNSQGVITRVVRYPYGKKNFIFPTEKEPTQVVQPTTPQKTASPSQLSATLENPLPPPVPPATEKVLQTATPPDREPQGKSGFPPIPEAVSADSAAVPQKTSIASTSRMTTQALQASVAPPGPPDMDAATRLELDMTREEVRQILGLPEKIEGFRVKGKAIIIWSYTLEDRIGRRLTAPLIFENGQLSGWGDAYYRRIMQEISNQ